jgi:hypothetical protein
MLRQDSGEGWLTYNGMRFRYWRLKLCLKPPNSYVVANIIVLLHENNKYTQVNYDNCYKYKKEETRLNLFTKVLVKSATIPRN